MNSKITPWLALGAASLWLAGCGTTPSPQHNTTNSSKSNSAPSTTSKTAKTGKPLKVIAFYDQTMTSTTPDPFALVKAHPGLVDYLSPFWYEVSATGSVTSKPEGNAAILARQDNLPLLPLFNNAGGGSVFLHSASTRTAAINNIVSLVKSKHYRGVNIDFQLLKSTDRTDLTAFMQQLQKSMPKGDIISMSVVPLNSGNGQSSAYDFPALDKVVNSMVLMAYDFHGDGTPPGPVSPYAWVQQGITTALKAGIQPSKLYLGIADYGYLWTNSSTKAATIPLKAMHQHKYGVYTWNNTYKEATDTYTSGGVSHTIWFVNDKAAADRIALAKQYHLGGVAFWRIGYEDAKWWNTVAAAIGTGSPTSGSTTTTQGSRPKLSPQQLKKTVKAPANNAKNTVKKSVRKTNTNIIAPAKNTVNKTGP